MKELLSGTGVLVFTGIYLAVLVAIAMYASLRARKVSSDVDPRDEHELGGRSLPLLVLLGTLYASQYSGNSFVGFSGKAARDGYEFIGSVLFMQSVIVGYLLYAGRLFRLSRIHRYRTPADFLLHRYEHKGLHLLSSALMIFALLNFVLSQLVAIGKITMVMGQTSDGMPLHPAWGIVSLALLMVLYETFGGMRAVAWTDMLQGAMLLVGAMGLFILLENTGGGMAGALTRFRELWPDKVSPPRGRDLGAWVGSIVLFAAGAACYPHAIQRIYAAGSAKILRRSMAIMVFMPLITTLPLFLIGIYAQTLAGAKVLGSDEAMPLVLDYVAGTPVGSVIALVVLAGAVSAMMSTADSALLTTSSIVNRDWLERYLIPGKSPQFYLRCSKITSWVVVASIAAVSIWSVANGHRIWQILSIKLEVLMQTAPAIWFGVRGRHLSGQWAFRAMLVGALITLLGWLTWHNTDTGSYLLYFPTSDVPKNLESMRTLLGVQVGVWGLGANLIVCAAGSRLSKMRASEDVAG